IPMTLLEVDEVTADPRGKPRGGEVLVLNPFQVIVAEQRIRLVDETAGRFVFRQRIEDRVVSGQQRSPITESSRMSQLQSDQQIVIVATGLAMSGSAFGQHAFD